EEARRAGHRQRAVDVAGHGVRRASEVDGELVVGDANADSYGDVVVDDAITFDLAGGGVLAVGKLPDRGAGAAFGVGDDLVEGREDGVVPTTFHQLGEAMPGELVGGDLGAEVSAAHSRGAGVRQDQ